MLILLMLAGASTATDDTDVPPVAEEQCGSDRGLAPLAAALSDVGRAADARDVEAFGPAWELVQARVSCLQVVVSPDLAAAVHAADYLDVAIAGEQQAMGLALAGALGVPGARPPEWLKVAESAEPAQGVPFISVKAPEHTALFVDGLPATARPADRAALVQAVGPAGEVLWSRWMHGEEPLPEGFVEAAQTEAPSGPELLREVTDLLAAGEYQQVIDKAIPASNAHPSLREGFLAAADLAADQIRRAHFDATDMPGFDPYAPRPRRGALKRGDDRRDFLFGFDVGLPSAIHGEWKIGRTVDGLGLKIGGGAMLYGGSSVYTGVDSSIYLDWNLTARWQLQTTVLGIFFNRFASPSVNFGGGVQYDPPSPLEITVGLRAGPYTVVPTATVGFLW